MAEPVVVHGSLRLLGSGMAVPICPTPDGPLPVVTNADVARVLAPLAETERRQRAIERMLADSGCLQRHWAHWIGGPARSDEPTAATLAEAAARQALTDAGLSISDIDLVILAHSTSTLPTIATSTPLCDALGYRGPSLDLKAGCAGSLHGLQLASSLLASGYRRILLIGADTMTKYVDPPALLGWPNVGDGAGAVVLGPAEGRNFVSVLYGDYDTWRAAGVLDPLPPQADAAFVMRGSLADHQGLIVERYAGSLRHVVAAAGRQLSDLTAWIPHQISPALLTAVWRSLEAPSVELVLNHDRYGNTGAGSMLIALHEHRHALAGGRIGLSALGGGMRWGSALWEEPCQTH